MPVGSLDKLRHSAEGRRPFSLLTCSRLVAEKHIDWLVEGVVLAQKQLPDLTFDIYGAGYQQSKLASMIEQRSSTKLYSSQGPP